MHLTFFRLFACAHSTALIREGGSSLGPVLRVSAALCCLWWKAWKAENRKSTLISLFALNSSFFLGTMLIGLKWLIITTIYWTLIPCQELHKIVYLHLYISSSHQCSEDFIIPILQKKKLRPRFRKWKIFFHGFLERGAKLEGNHVFLAPRLIPLTSKLEPIDAKAWQEFRKE